MGKLGWPFASVDPYPGAEVDDFNHAEHIKDLYLKADPDYPGRYAPILTFGSLKSINPYHRFSVPVLWDNQTSTVVNNESSEIIRILNTAFNHLLPEKYANLDLYPSGLQAEIDSTNEWLYESVNSQCLLGFMTLYCVH